MPRKMNMGLQKQLIKAEVKKRGNLHHPDLRGTESQEGLIEIAIENLDPMLHYNENLGNLERDGILLPKEEDYKKQQEELDKEEERLENERVVKMMRRRYGLKPLKPKPVKKNHSSNK